MAGYRLLIAYQELLDQFRDGENLGKLLDAIYKRFEDTDYLLSKLLTDRGVETSFGVWLDNAGLIVGITRPNEFYPDSNIFTVKDDPGDPDDPDKAFDNGYFQSLYGITIPGVPMSDTNFRLYVKAKAGATNRSPSLPSICRFVMETFSVDATVDSPVGGLVRITFNEPVTNEVRFMTKRLAPIGGGFDSWVVQG